MSGAQWSLVHFNELPIVKADLEGVNEDAVALFSVTSYAVSELNVIAKLMLASTHPPEKDNVINAAGFIHSACVLRYWILKLFEFSECLSEAKNKGGRLNEGVVKVVSGLLEGFEELKGHKSYYLARNIRNESVGHYSVFTAKKNLGFVENQAMAHMVIHDMSGNSFFPLGEEVMFVGRMNRHGASLNTDEGRVGQLNELFQWSKRANRWVRECHMSVFSSLIYPNISKKLAKKRVYWMSPRKTGSVEDFNVPLFATSGMDENP